MNYRAAHMELYLKKKENGDKQWMKWKGKDIGEIEGMHINNKVIEKFQKHQYNKCWIFVGEQRDSIKKHHFIRRLQ